VVARQLELSDKAVELLAYFALKEGASFKEACAALWPSAAPEDGAAFFKQTVDEINRVVRETTTGNPSALIVPAGTPSARTEPEPPRIMVRVLGPIPYVEVVE
jgi:hypothetical protein